MEAPAGAEYSFTGEWRRSPAQPVTLLTGSANQSLPPCQAIPRFKRYRSLCAPSEWSRQGVAAVGAYLRVMRPVRAAYGRVTQDFQRYYLQRLRFLVTSFIIKSEVVPALRAGRPGLVSGGNRASGRHRGFAGEGRGGSSLVRVGLNGGINE